MTLRHAVMWAAMWAAPLMAQAGQVYGAAGLPGVMLGYTHTLAGGTTLRGDLSTLRVNDRAASEEGIDYKADAKLNRLGLFADWFVWRGLRLTGGVTFNDMELNLRAQGNGGTFIIGGTSYPTSPEDVMDVKIEFPKTTPYLGLGWGHHQGSGFGFVFDLGASIGRAKITASTSGPNLGLVNQADLENELAQLRGGVGEVKFFPQVSLGMTYKF